MRISELSRASGVPVATIKYYLREGLLPAGERTAATQASYDEEHVRRLALIKALTGVGGLSVAATRDVIAAIEDPPPLHHLLGMVNDAVSPATHTDVDLGRARALVRRWGWRIDPHDLTSLAALETALSAIDAAGLHLPETTIDAYAGTLGEIAREEVATVPTGSVEESVEFVVLGTLLVEPLLIALRRLALQNASAERFGA